MKAMHTNACQSETNFDNTVMTINLDQPFEVNTHYSLSQYVKVNIALATTLIGAMLIKPAVSSPASLLSNNAASTDTAVNVLDNSQQFINREKTITFADNGLPIQPKHAKRAGFGGEFQINTYSSNHQRDPSVAGLSTGNFVTVWQSSGQDGDLDGIYGKRFSNAGIPQGSEFRVNTYTVNHQSAPSIAALNTGDFVVVWQSNGQDGDNYGIYGQRFSSTGAPQGSEFQINTYTTSRQEYPSVVALTTGDFVVVWQSGCYSPCVGQDGSEFGIYGRRYSSIGVPQGSEFQINTYTTSEQEYPSVATLTTGDFVVVWQSRQDGANTSINGQRFSSTGVPQGSEFQINTYTTSRQDYPSIAGLSTGDFVVVWESGGQDGSNQGIYGQRFNSTDDPQGSEFQVNTYITNGQRYPSIAALNTGDFVVVWRSDGQDSSINGVYGQPYSSMGVPQGSEFQINTYTTLDQDSPSVADLSTGDFVVVWESDGQDGDFDGVYGRVYFNDSVPPKLINNTLIINEGETIILSAANLSALDPDNNPSELAFTVNNVQHGQFERVLNANIAITSFTQQDIIDGSIQFVHDGSDNQPIYDVSVSDGSLTDGPKAAIITFTSVSDMPQLLTNTLSITQGQTVILNSGMFFASDVDNDNTQIRFLVTNVQHARFEKVSNLGTAISGFTQDELLTGKIQFVHDDSEAPPVFDIAVTDGVATTTPVVGNVIYTNINSAPLLISNQLFINQGDTKILNRLNIEVTDDDNVADEITIAVTNLKNGYFSTIYNPTTHITTFTQQDINDGKIQFTQQGDGKPTYTLTVTDNDGATSTDNPGSTDPIANINFVPKATGVNPIPIIAGIAGGAALLGGCIAGSVLFFKKAQDRKTRQQNEFARKIRHHLGLQKVDNFDTQKGQQFIEAVQTLIDLLKENQGIDIATMDDSRLDLLASNIATSAKNKINPSTIGPWKKSAITIQEFSDNIEEIAQDNRLDDISHAEVSGDDVSIPMHTM